MYIYVQNLIPNPKKTRKKKLNLKFKKKYSMEEINSWIFQGCKLARDLESNLPNLANQPNVLSKSCDEIVRIFSAARDRLSAQGSSSTSYGGLIHDSQMSGLGGGGMQEWLRFASTQAMGLLKTQLLAENSGYDVHGGLPETRTGGMDVPGHELGGREVEGSMLFGGGDRGEVQPMDSGKGASSWQRQRRRKDDVDKRRVLMAAPLMGNTEIPPDDGYTWRKYGQKEILGSKYPRSYYRCTHQKLYQCPARKQVQRLDNDPYTFEVIYCAHHTCHMSSTAPSVPPLSPETVPPMMTHSPPPPTSVPLSTWLSMDIKQTSGEGTSSFTDPQARSLFRDLGLTGGAAGTSSSSMAGGSSGGAGPSTTVRYGRDVDFPVADLADAMFNSGSSSNNSMELIFSSMEDNWEPGPAGGEKKN